MDRRNNHGLRGEGISQLCCSEAGFLGMPDIFKSDNTRLVHVMKTNGTGIFLDPRPRPFWSCHQRLLFLAEPRRG